MDLSFTLISELDKRNWIASLFRFSTAVYNGVVLEVKNYKFHKKKDYWNFMKKS